MIKRTEDEIEDVLAESQDAMSEGTKWPAMSYEEGVQAALLWVLGETDSNPMEE